MPKAYYIVHWDEANETAESRKYKTLSWFGKINKMDGLGFSRLRLHPERVELYCAWALIEIIASRGAKGKRGWLVRDGKPLTADDLAFLTSFPEAIFELALEYFSSAESGWLVHREMPGDSPGTPAEHPIPAGSPGAPGDSPGTPADAGKISATDRQTVQTDRPSLKEGSSEPCREMPGESPGAGEAPLPEVAIPSLKEVLTWAATSAVDPDYAAVKHAETEERSGWVIAGKVVDWRKRFLRFWGQDREGWLKKKKKNSATNGNGRTTAQARFEINQELEALRERLDAAHESNQPPDRSDKAREKKLRAELAALPE